MNNKGVTPKKNSPYFQKGFEAAIDNNGKQVDNPYLESAAEQWVKGFDDGLEFLKEYQSK